MWNDTDKETPQYSEKNAVPLSFFSQQAQHKLVLECNWHFHGRGSATISLSCDIELDMCIQNFRITSYFQHRIWDSLTPFPYYTRHILSLKYRLFWFKFLVSRNIHERMLFWHPTVKTTYLLLSRIQSSHFLRNAFPANRQTTDTVSWIVMPRRFVQG